MGASYLHDKRAGTRPRTTPTNPHTQLDQNAPPALQEKVFALARGLPDVVVGSSLVSVTARRSGSGDRGGADPRVARQRVSHRRGAG